MQVNVAAVFYAARQFERGIKEAMPAVELGPRAGSTRAFYLMGLCNHFLGHADHAIDLLQESRLVAPEHVIPVVGLAYVLAQNGRRAQAVELVDQLKVRATRAEVSPYDFAEVYTGLGETLLAVEYTLSGLSITRARPPGDRLRSSI